MRFAVTGLFTLACLYTAYLAADLLIPLSIAVLMSLALLPLVRLLQRLAIPRTLGALVVVGGVIGLLGGAATVVWQPAMNWMSHTPEMLADLQPRIEELLAPIESLKEATQGIASTAEAAVRGEQALQVTIRESTLTEAVAAEGPQVIASAIAIVFLMYFLLAYGDVLTAKGVRLAQNHFSEHEIIAIGRLVQAKISRYLLVLTVVNTVLAVIVGTALAAVGFPDPILWGTVAGLLNFAPYVGPTLTAFLLCVVGLLNLESVRLALLVPAGFIAITTVEGQLIKPTLLGSQLSLSPYVVFLAIIVWGWMWGMVGALMAVPLVVILKILADHVPGLEWLSIVLERGVGDSAQQTSPDDVPG